MAAAGRSRLLGVVAIGQRDRNASGWRISDLRQDLLERAAHIIQFALPAYHRGAARVLCSPPNPGSVMEFIVSNSRAPVWPPKDGRSRMDDREQRVREIANLLWEEEGCPDGRADQYWAAAEAVLNARASRGSAGAAPADGRDTDGADLQGLIHDSSANILARLESLEKRHQELQVEVGKLAKSLELGDPERVDMAL